MPIKVGDLRPSQAIYTYGIGASIELPHITGIVMGLEEWNTAYLQEIHEDRVLQAVRSVLGHQVARLCSPPIPKVSAGPLSMGREDEVVGIPVATFPTWLRCPACNQIGKVTSGLFELKPDPFRPERTCYRHTNCQKALKVAPVALPVRFMVACEHGHFDDFPWVDFVHRGKPCPSPRLKIHEIGVSGAVSDVYVHCESCDAKARPMSDAFGEENRETMPDCRARRPHLRDFQEPKGDEEKSCDKKMKAILLGASNSWFPLTVSALYIPSSVSKLGKLVEVHWAVLDKAKSKETLEAFRSAFLEQFQPFANFSTDQIWQEIESRRQGPPSGEEDKVDIKGPEWEMFSNPKPERNMADFHLTTVSAPQGYDAWIEKVVLAERLREVKALVGFTRIDSPGDFGETLEVPADRRMPISRVNPTWVPASEVRGEGIFVQFKENVLRDWLANPDVAKREMEFRIAHRKWREMRHIEPADEGFPGMRFILIHSFAHALMRQIAMECGYTAASIRERIYSRSPEEEGGPMAGVLVYTAAPDSEGTLGGLVSLGESAVLGRHITHALDEIRLCASDPLCAEHSPHHGTIALHGAACHACLFSPETSCERGNKYLDRNILVPTVQGFRSTFFGGNG